MKRRVLLVMKNCLLTVPPVAEVTISIRAHVSRLARLSILLIILTVHVPNALLTAILAHLPRPLTALRASPTSSYRNWKLTLDESPHAQLEPSSSPPTALSALKNA